MDEKFKRALPAKPRFSGIFYRRSQDLKYWCGECPDQPPIAMAIIGVLTSDGDSWQQKIMEELPKMGRFEVERIELGEDRCFNAWINRLDDQSFIMEDLIGRHSVQSSAGGRTFIHYTCTRRMKKIRFGVEYEQAFDFKGKCSCRHCKE